MFVAGGRSATSTRVVAARAAVGAPARRCTATLELARLVLDGGLLVAVARALHANALLQHRVDGTGRQGGAVAAPAAWSTALTSRARAASSALRASARCTTRASRTICKSGESRSVGDSIVEAARFDARHVGAPRAAPRLADERQAPPEGSSGGGGGVGARRTLGTRTMGLRVALRAAHRAATKLGRRRWRTGRCVAAGASAASHETSSALAYALYGFGLTTSTPSSLCLYGATRNGEGGEIGGCCSSAHQPRNGVNARPRHNSTE